MSFAVTSLGVLIAPRDDVDAGLPDGHELPGHAALLPERRHVPDGLGARLDARADAVDPLVYGVDAIRNVVFSETVVRTANGMSQSLAEAAHAAGLVRWSLPYDLALISLAAVVLTAAGAWSFSTSQVG